MSLFGESPPRESALEASSPERSRNSLFDDEPAGRGSGSGLFQEDDLSGSGSGSPWDMPTPRKQQSRADIVRSLLAGAEVPDSYVEAFDTAAQEPGSGGGKVSSAAVSKTLAGAKLDSQASNKITSIIGEGDLGRSEFNVLLALIGLAQEGETVSLDGVDERRRNLPQPRLATEARKPDFPDMSELAAKPPQPPVTPVKAQKVTRGRGSSLQGPEDDPWNTPEMHRNHNHVEPIRSQPESTRSNGFAPSEDNFEPGLHDRTTSTFTTSDLSSSAEPVRESAGAMQSPSGAWGYFDGTTNNPNEFSTAPNPTQGSSPFGSNPGAPAPSSGTPAGHSRTVSSGRTGNAVEEHIIVTLMPEKEGMFMFQHHNYEVSSSRRGSKVVRRYSDFVWLLDCLHKRYPFRVLPLLPPKRVAVNGNHLSNDGAFIEKRRRGLSRFLNALVRHPVLGQEQLVIMFLTVPTELSVWRKQATISVQDEFTDRSLPPGLEDSLPMSLNELFDRSRQGIRRSADLYIGACNLMDRLVKRSEGVAADHARLAVSLASLTETSADTYATDTNDVPLLNDGLVATSKHLRQAQGLLEDESKAWDEGVLEDLKRQRDALVSFRELFDRRERLDKDNIPFLERRIQSNETKLASLRAKPDGMVKPGEIEKVVEAIIKDKESIVNQHNRSVFVRECIRDELLYFQTTQYHVSRWNQDWAQERVKYSEMLADNWRRLLDELDGMPTGD